MKSVLFAILLIFSITLLAEPVDSTEAKIIAANFYQYKNQKRSWANVKKTIVMQYKGINTRYTFVFANNDFVIVSADNATVPVFAYSENGSYNNEDKPPAYEYWMQTEYDEWVYYVRQNNISNAETIEQWNNIKTNNFSQYRSNSSVDPLIETRWGQSFTNDGVCPGYNFFVQNNNNCGCDHCTAGCVAVAMAQIMNFWRSPDNDFDWCNMTDSLIKLDINSNQRANYETERNAIAELIADCRDKSDINYCRKIDKETSCLSGTSTGKAKRALRNDYKYSNDMLHRYRCLTMSWKPKMRK
ncbi:MAG: Spi family protease inhibitor, partial [Bacteroidota bacterium]|nr:Spi family protease inhibitor [Bacteroidota bacterium]